MTPGLARAVILLATLVAAAGTARLGWWQLDRAAQKIRLQSATQARQLLPPLAPALLARDAVGVPEQLHRRISLQGRWLAERTVYLENRQMNGRTGFYALTPLLLDDGSVVLVQRGWLPRDVADRTRIVAPPPPAGPVTIDGQIAAGPSRLFEFAAEASGVIRQNLDPAAFARETGLALRPVTVVQLASGDGAADGLLRQWPQPAADVQKHYGYAFQWFALSTLVVGLYVWFQLIRPRRARHA